MIIIANLSNGVDLFCEECWLYFPILPQLHDDSFHEEFIATEKVDTIGLKQWEVAEVKKLIIALLLFLDLHDSNIIEND